MTKIGYGKEKTGYGFFSTDFTKIGSNFGYDS